MSHWTGRKHIVVALLASNKCYAPSFHLLSPRRRGVVFRILGVCTFGHSSIEQLDTIVTICIEMLRII
eukprot:scaffold12529_cov117-Skeletonema_dohrnii-CCMP3373.AAC.2